MSIILNWILTYSIAIQTICSILGLCLAIFAIFFAVVQINISQKQRAFQLSSDYLKDNYSAMQIVENIILKSTLAKIDFNEAKLLESDASLKEQFNSYTTLIDNALPSLINSRDQLEELFNLIHDKKIKLSINTVEDSLTQRIKILSIVNQTENKLNEMIRICNSNTKLKNHLRSISKKIEDKEQMLNELKNKNL
ncbi:hypothetical protein PGK15_02700 [Acinetobacter baumannii]|nr:hypothetical protein [Acinetobacter baumannii]